LRAAPGTALFTAMGGSFARVWLGLILLPGVAAAQSVYATPDAAAAVRAETDELFRLGQIFFDQLAPPQIKAAYRFPSKEQWDAYVTKFLRALETNSLEELASCAEDGRAALGALRLVPGYGDLADWLEQRIDEMEGARLISGPRTPAPPSPPTAPTRPGTKAPVPPAAAQPVPHYNAWLARVRERPLPGPAKGLMPRLRAAFVAEGVPPELAWIAEAESSLNPSARSPVGAKGLFQFMPETAREMGLSTRLPDDRTDPDKSGRAAARYLRTLHRRFGNWALVLAAYNAGQGRVARTLEAHKATTFTQIADALPAETRMYVPKVCALIATRTGVTPYQIPPPR
jgi:membrane-bound lytic murein transglycosylase D